MSLSYEQQLKRKHDLVSSAIATASLSALVEPCVPSDRLLGSRNKAKMVVGGSARQPELGIMLEGFRFQELAACPLVDERVPPLLVAIREGISRHCIDPYDVARRKGELKYCIVRMSERSGEAIARFVLRSRSQAERVAKLAVELTQQFSDLKVVSINLQPVHQAVLEGEEEFIVSAVDHIRDPLGRYEFLCGPQSFAQVTSNVAVKLYEFVASHAQAIRPKRVLDLFCGIGGFSTFCAPYSENIQGVELSAPAIQDAVRSAEHNRITNTHFLAADVEAYLEQLVESPNLIVINPPRRGLSPRIIERLLKLRAPHIIYSSCNPTSLARDLAELSDAYTVKTIRPFDMFPLTEHVEVVAVLESA